MLLSEFIERTGITPEHEEWQAINTMYMMADCDKDEFCKLWCKMNAQRVKAAKEQKAKEKREVAAIEYIEKTYHKSMNDVQADFVGSMYDFLDTEKLERLNKALAICGLKAIDASLSIHNLAFNLNNQIDLYWDKVAQKYA